MQAYINSMQSLDISPFSLDYKNTHLFYKTADPCECPMDSEVVRIAESIAVKTLKETLESLFCIEVMFKVAVGTEDADNKNYEEKRKVKDMEFFEVDEKKIVNCIYREKAEDV